VKGNRGAGRVRVVAGGGPLVSSAGGALLVAAARVTGLARELSAALAPWRASRSLHDPGKVVLDLAVAIALGGDCLADVAVVRAQPELFGPVASDPTVSRLIDVLAADVEVAVAAIRRARAAARSAAWRHGWPVSGDGPVVVDLDATIVCAHSDKQGAAPTWKRTFGFHPLLAFVDHGVDGTGEPLAALLRAGSASASTPADHIEVLDAALAQLPACARARVLVRADAGGASKTFLHHVTNLGLAYSVGFRAMDPVQVAIQTIPRQAWRAAIDADGTRREGAQVAELTRWMPATQRNDWPDGMRVIARREIPHPGAQLRLTDHDGWRITCFATNTAGGRVTELELRHRMRARAEDRIRALKDSGLRNLPMHEFAKNVIWLELVQLAAELLTWTQTLAFPDTDAQRWEPKRLRLRILHVAGRLTRSGRRDWLRLPRSWPWAQLIVNGHAQLHTIS
jgi:DDE family transposase